MGVFKIKKSEISGKGTFAEKDLQKQEIIGLAFLKIKNTGNPDKNYKRTNLGAFTNHSDNPNLKIKKDKNKIFFVAKKRIKKNEELTIDYRNFDWEGKKDFI